MDLEVLRREQHKRRLSWMPWLYFSLKPRHREWAREWQREVHARFSQLETVELHEGAFISDEASIFAELGRAVVVGDGSSIAAHAFVHGPVVLRRNCAFGQADNPVTMADSGNGIRIPRGVAAVAAGTSFSPRIDRVNVVGQAEPAHIISSLDANGKTHYGIYDDFGQLKATDTKEYREIPSFRFVNAGQFPGAEGVTVEILDDAEPIGLRALFRDLEQDMRPGFVSELEEKAHKNIDSNRYYVDLNFPDARDYGVYRNLANRVLEGYGSVLSEKEVNALTRFRDVCESKSGPTMRANHDYLFPNMDANFSSLGGPVGDEIFGPGNGVILGTDPVVLPEPGDEKK